jgi:hypothetical protein
MKELRTYNGEINAEGNTVYYEDEELTIICKGCYQEPSGIFYHKDGYLHRVDGPAVEYTNGDKEWYLNGYLNRVDGPAMELNNGTKIWYLNDQRHRVDGPACEWSDSDKIWYLNGEKHRVDGPACEWSNGTKKWYLNDRLVYSKDENYLHKYNNLSESFKQSILKYELLGPQKQIS